MDKNRKQIAIVVAALLMVVAAALGYRLTRSDAPDAETRAEIAATKEERLQEACASQATYTRLKEVAFEEAVRIRNADPENLDTLAATAVVRMENPVVKSRDEALNLTVCTGKFVLELPPGAERGFGGERRLTADIEYAAQAAADGSGLVFQIEGAEPIIAKLAAFNMNGGMLAEPDTQDGEVELAKADLPEDVPPVSEPRAALNPAPAPVVQPAPSPSPTLRPLPGQRRPIEPAPEPEVEPEPRPAVASARPSFNCRVARSRSEQAVCGNGRLAGLDRAMSSQFYSALSGADPETRRALRRTRDRFLSYRERCGGDEACIADTYQGRMAEIRDIAGE